MDGNVYGDPMHGNAEPSSPEFGTADEQIAYTVPHAAKVLDIGERTMWDLVDKEEIESFTIGRSRRITRVALLAFVAKQGKTSAAVAAA